MQNQQTTSKNTEVNQPDWYMDMNNNNNNNNNSNEYYGLNWQQNDDIENLIPPNLQQ